ncbi:hypothetical protein CC2G_015278 [Coprinopsis cinerea AmutBmut pab1-1]|nr:hypothetical protein CC2G_015278 [Coprinopsis cinerea AmutBmut pab1-1]
MVSKAHPSAARPHESSLPVLRGGNAQPIHPSGGEDCALPLPEKGNGKDSVWLRTGVA